jgi:hypothetical protein
MRQSARRLLSFVVLAPLLVGLPGCGGGGSNANVAAPTPPTQPPAPPAAAMTVTAAGKLVVHPSADPKFAIALETPLELRETGGGPAVWAYARLSLFKGGNEIERNDFGASDLRAEGVSQIAPNSSHTYALIFRFNASDFDAVTVTLGFQDANTGNRLTVDVPFDSFPGVDINLTPMSLPHDRAVRID